MAYFTLQDVAAVHSAVNAVSNVHGAYAALKLLATALEEVQEPPEFSSEVRRLEAREGLAYQGPEGVGRQAVKAIRTAENAPPDQQEAVLKLVSLVICRLSAAQGARVLSMLLTAAGHDPSLLLLVVKLCVLLAQTEPGRRMIAGSIPALKSAFQGRPQTSQIAAHLERLAMDLGDQGYQLAASIADMPLDAVKSALHAGRKLSDLICVKTSAPGEDAVVNAEILGD